MAYDSLLIQRRKELHRLVAMAREIANPRQLWKSLQALGELQERKGARMEARSSYEAAIQIIGDTATRLKAPGLGETLLSAGPVQNIRENLKRVGG